MAIRNLMAYSRIICKQWVNQNVFKVDVLLLPIMSQPFFKTQTFLMIVTLCYWGCTDDDGLDCVSGGPLASISNLKNTSCGLDNGSYTLSVSGGQSPYSYSLSGADFIPLPDGSFDIESVIAGNYELVIRDTEGCEANTTVSITNQESLTASSTITDSGCGSAAGRIEFEVSGGQEPYTLSLNGGTTQTDLVFSDLTPGDYEAQIVDQGGCETNVTINLISGTSYKDEIIPIIEASCAVADCHDGSDTALPDWTMYANVEALAETIKRRTGNRTMPPPGSPGLTTAEIQAIACWVDDGALNN